MSLLSSSSSLSLLLWREGVEARSQLTDGWEEQLNRSRVFEEKKKSKTPKKRERNRRERTKKKTKKKKKKKSLFFRFQVLDFFLSFFLSFFSLSTPLSRWRSTPPRHVRSSSLLFFSFSLSLSLPLSSSSSLFIWRKVHASVTLFGEEKKIMNSRARDRRGEEGRLRLRCDETLHLLNGATILGTPSEKDLKRKRHHKHLSYLSVQGLKHSQR